MCKNHTIYLYITFLTEGMNVKLIPYCDAKSSNHFSICCNRDCATDIFYTHTLCTEKNKLMKREAFYYNEIYEDFSRDLFGTFVNCYK